MFALLMIIPPFIAHLNHFGVPCGSSATEILCLLDVGKKNDHSFRNTRNIQVSFMQ